MALAKRGTAPGNGGSARLSSLSSLSPLSPPPAPARRPSLSSLPSILSLALAAALSTGTAGCGARLHTGAAVPPVVPAASHGAASTEPRYFPPPFALASAEDAVVRLVGPQMTCTGTLVDEDLVLTAVHCLVKRGERGEFTRELVAPSDLKIELGGDYLAWGQVGVSAIVAPVSPDDGKPCGQRGKADDVAVLVLPRKLVGLAVIPPRLDAPPVIGEKLDRVGFGRCAMSSDAIHRRSSVDPFASGASRRDMQTGWPIGARTDETFEMKAAICPGDSGGPMLSTRNGARVVVGVVSMSRMDGDEATLDYSVMTRVDAYRALFARAKLIAEGASPSELPPVACAR